MEQNHYLVVKCTPLDDQWETDAAREPIADWDKAPCEYSDEDTGEEELEEFWQNEDMGFDPYLGCYTDDY